MTTPKSAREEFEARIVAVEDIILNDCAESSYEKDIHQAYTAGFSDPLVTELVRAAKKLISLPRNSEHAFEQLNEAIGNYEQAKGENK